MIRNETFSDGTCIAAKVIDLDKGTVTTEEHGKVVSVRDLTLAERAACGPPPLDALGVAMTVLAVEGVVTLPVAAAAAQVTQDALIHEALSWSAAAELKG